MKSKTLNPEQYDLLVIGGGINGAAIARDATLRGLKVLLVEKRDFASGASSKSSKLIHGGLRYLQQLDFGLVKEALEERAILLKTAPYHVKLLPFLLPVYQKQSRPLWMIRLGLTLYDWFTPAGIPPHQGLSAERIAKEFPGLKGEGLKGGALYFDAEMRDQRLVIENLRSAEKAGAAIRNYTEVLSISGTGPYRVALKETLQQIEFEIAAQAIVNATGAWSNGIDPQIKLAPTKGVHIVLPLVHPSLALTLTAPQDNRIFFVLPWNGYTLVGTTETAYTGDPALATVEEEDVRYLLTAFHAYFPKYAVSREDVIASFAGVRPLLKSFSASRKHKLLESPQGILSLVGGKYTTYRRMAEETVDRVVKKFPARTFLPCQTRTLSLYTDSVSEQEIQTKATALQLPSTQLSRLLENYGPATFRLLELMEQNPELKEPLCPHHPHLLAELCFACQEEHVKTSEDWFQRRTSIAYSPCRGIACRESVDKHIRMYQNR